MSHRFIEYYCTRVLSFSLLISLNVGQFDRKVHCGVGFLISIVIDSVDLVKVLFDERVYPNIRVSSFLFIFIMFYFIHFSCVPGFSNFVFRVLVFRRSGVPAFRHSSVPCFSTSPMFLFLLKTVDLWILT